MGTMPCPILQQLPQHLKWQLSFQEETVLFCLLSCDHQLDHIYQMGTILLTFTFPSAPCRGWVGELRGFTLQTWISFPRSCGLRLYAANMLSRHMFLTEFRVQIQEKVEDLCLFLQFCFLTSASGIIRGRLEGYF